MADTFEEIKITPPSRKACRVCAATHAPDEPHDRDSLYYQNWFRKRYKRLPTWQDAMAHCSEETKKRFIKTLARRGITLEDTKEDGRRVEQPGHQPS